MEGYLLKLKSTQSRKLFTNYVKRYFILDLKSQTLSYKTTEKAMTMRMTVPLSSIVCFHPQSALSKDKVAKDVRLEWQYDFMLEFR